MKGRIVPRYQQLVLITLSLKGAGPEKSQWPHCPLVNLTFQPLQTRVQRGQTKKHSLICVTENYSHILYNIFYCYTQ